MPRYSAVCVIFVNCVTCPVRQVVPFLFMICESGGPDVNVDVDEKKQDCNDCEW